MTFITYLKNSEIILKNNDYYFLMIRLEHRNLNEV